MRSIRSWHRWPDVRLTLVRHAESESNAAEEIRGADAGLTAHGVAQAEALGSRIHEFEGVRLIASDMRRARLNVEAGFGSDVAVTYDARWCERDFGQLVGLGWHEVSERYPKYLDLSGPFSREAYDWPAPDGESWAQMASRVREAVDELRAEDADAVIVCHGGPIRVAVCLLLEIDPAVHVWNFWPSNTSIARLTVHDGPAILESWNDTSHLPPELRS